MKHFLLFQATPIILVTDAAKPILRREIRAKTQMTWSKAPAVTLSIMILGFLVSMKLSIVICFFLESNPDPSEAETRAREKGCRSYDLQPLKGKEWIVCSRGTRADEESTKKQISSLSHFFKII
jgi:hypothetical protein